MLKVEAQILDILSALLFSVNSGNGIRLWAGRLLTRCLCQRLGSSPLRLLQATNHADLQDAMPPIECFELALPETSSSYGEVDDFITTLAITSASEGTIVAGSSQGMVRTKNIDTVHRFSVHLCFLLREGFISKFAISDCGRLEITYLYFTLKSCSFHRSTSTTRWRRKGARPFHFTLVMNGSRRARITPSPPSRFLLVDASSCPVVGES